MNPETERGAVLSVSGYVRRKPVDPDAEARERVNRELRRDKGLSRWTKRLARMDSELRRTLMAELRSDWTALGDDWKALD